MGKTTDMIVAVVAKDGLPHEIAIGLTVAEAERKLIDKLREDVEILALVKAAKEAAPKGDETDFFGRDVFFDLLRSEGAFGYQWFEEQLTID
jgi:phosphopantetheinyl transferase (holo-ACP synthase)